MDTCKTALKAPPRPESQGYLQVGLTEPEDCRLNSEDKARGKLLVSEWSHTCCCCFNGRHFPAWSYSASQQQRPLRNSSSGVCTSLPICWETMLPRFSLTSGTSSLQNYSEFGRETWGRASHWFLVPIRNCQKDIKEIKSILRTVLKLYLNCHFKIRKR